MIKVSVVTTVLVALGVAAGCSSADPAASETDTATSALGANSELNNPLPRHLATQERFAKEFAGGGGSGGNLSYHGGGTLTSAHVVPIYWGPSWSTSGSADNAMSTTLTSYVANYGTTSHYNVITQYYSGKPATYIQESNLGSTAYYDSSTPPADVTDADVQAEAQKIISAHGFDASAIYEVFLPASSYSSDGTSTSCGGPSLKYCAYHGNFTATEGNVKYASMPYPSCGGCQSAGFDTAQNFEHFISHETREAVTDEDGNAWYDHRGYEADDKCAWTPAPFVDSSTGYAYQYEWSNKASGCVQGM